MMALLLSTQDDLSDLDISTLDEYLEKTLQPGPVSCNRCTHSEDSDLAWFYGDNIEPNPPSPGPKSWREAWERKKRGMTAAAPPTAPGQPPSHHLATEFDKLLETTIYEEKRDASTVLSAEEITTGPKQQLASTDPDPAPVPKAQTLDAAMFGGQEETPCPPKRKRGPLTPPAEETPWIYDDPEELYPVTNKRLLRLDEAESQASPIMTPQELQRIRQLKKDLYIPEGLEEFLVAQAAQASGTGVGTSQNQHELMSPQSLLPPLGASLDRMQFHNHPLLASEVQQGVSRKAINGAFDSGCLPLPPQDLTFIPREAVSFQKSLAASLTDKVQARVEKCEPTSKPVAEAVKDEEATSDQLGLDGRSIVLQLQRKDGQRLLDRYFDYFMPTFRFLHRPTVQEWLDDFYFEGGDMKDRRYTGNKKAILLLVFALGILQIPEKARPGRPGLCEQLYYSAVRETRTSKFYPLLTEGIQVRLLRCLYHLEQSRINQCVELFNDVAVQSVRIGLPRDQDVNGSRVPSVIDIQTRRRTFWCIYAIDILLATIREKPLCFSEEISIPLPACVDDEELHMADGDSAASRIEYETPNELTGNPSIMFPVIAHIKLSHILASKIRVDHADKPSGAYSRHLANKRIHTKLQAWMKWVTRWAKSDDIINEQLLSIVSRQLTVLKLSYSQALIYVDRPIIMTTVMPKAPDEVASLGEEQIFQKSLDVCLQAAMSTALTIHAMDKDPNTMGRYMPTPYLAFAAALVLYLVVLHKERPPTKADCFRLEAASRCRRHIVSRAEEGSLIQRYLIVLDELRVNAFRSLGGWLHVSNAALEVIKDSDGPEMRKKALAVSALPAGASAAERERALSGALGEGCAQWREFMKRAWPKVGTMHVLLDDWNHCL